MPIITHAAREKNNNGRREKFASTNRSGSQKPKNRNRDHMKYETNCSNFPRGGQSAYVTELGAEFAAEFGGEALPR